MIDYKTAQSIAFSHPIPGQSWIKPPKSTPWQKPPVYVNMEDAMNYLMDNLTEPQHLKEILNLMDSGMAIDAIAKTVLFTGFTMGKWTATLMLLMYKPLVLALTMMAHKAKLHHTPVVLPQTHSKYFLNQTKKHALYNQVKNANKNPEPIQPESEPQPQGQGFMQRGNT